MPVSEAQKKATNKYLAEYDDIKIRVPKGERAKYKDFAAQRGMSLNSLIIELLEKEMKNIGDNYG